MIDQLSTILFAATSSKSVVPQDILEFIESDDMSIDLGEGFGDLENPAPFLEYLLRQYNPPVASTEQTIKPQLPPDVQPILTDITEQTISTPDADGQELPPSGGNRIPLAGFVGKDLKLMLIPLPVQGAAEVPIASEPTVSSLTALNRGAGAAPVPDHVLDLQSSPAPSVKALGNRVLWMVNQNVQAAELRVNPPQLGPVEVRISVEGDQSNVSLYAQHSAVREVMESTIPRLRDMLAESGLNLANIDVSQHDLSQRRHETSRFLTPRQEQHETSVSHGNASSGLENLQSSPIGLGLIDFYA